jgi:hypothetical protein
MPFLDRRPEHRQRGLLIPAEGMQGNPVLKQMSHQSRFLNESCSVQVPRWFL